MRKSALLRCTCLIALLVALLFQAAQAQGLDLEKTGSIALTLKKEDGKPVTGGEYWLFQVGEAVVRDNNLTFELTEEFRASGASLADLKSATLAGELAKYAQAHESLTRRTQKADAQGQARFEQVACGLYLVMQKPGTEGDYQPMAAFLASVPLRAEGGWSYDVTALPKVEPTPQPTTTPGPTSTPGSSLPQTGLNRWPVPVMAVSGLLLFGLGWVLAFTRKKHD